MIGSSEKPAVFYGAYICCEALAIRSAAAQLIMISTSGGAIKARGFTISWVATPEDAPGIKGRLGLSFAPGKNCSRGGETWSRSM